MADPRARFDELVKLGQRHCRMTPQRLVLLRLLASGKDRPNAAQPSDRLSAHFPTTTLAAALTSTACVPAAKPLKGGCAQLIN